MVIVHYKGIVIRNPIGTFTSHSIVFSHSRFRGITDLHWKELHSTNTDKETLGKYYEDKTVRRYDLEEQTAYAHSHILPSDLPDDETTSHNI